MRVRVNFTIDLDLDEYRDAFEVDLDKTQVRDEVQNIATTRLLSFLIDEGVTGVRYLGKNNVHAEGGES